MSEQEQSAVLTVSGMTKTFGVITALNNVDFTLRRGEIHGLIGENGSGKSTLTSIIAGMNKSDNGEMNYKGYPWNPSSMLDALSKGVGMIVQESGTIPGITVAENIFIGELNQFKKGGLVRRKKLFAAARAALDKIGANNIDEKSITGALDFQSRKLVEIARVMRYEPEVIIVDETTTALSQIGRDILYDIVKKRGESGGSVIFISHDMDEILNVCDTLTTLRDGKIIRTFEKSEFDADNVRAAMIGRDLEGDYYRSDCTPSYKSEIVLEAKDLASGYDLQGVSLELHKGEILGIGGLSHCGMHTLGKCLFGAIPPLSGETLVNGKRITSEAVAMKNKIGYVSKDRDVESLCLSANIRDNISIASLDKISRHRLLMPKAEKSYVKLQIEALAIKCFGMDQEVSNLSGGNKQKVVFGKWIGAGSEILILDCPTRGVDIGVKQAMYQLMVRLKNEGKSILLISEEMSELMGMCDRIIILKDGKKTKEFERSRDLTEMEIIRHMI